MFAQAVARPRARPRVSHWTGNRTYGKSTMLNIGEVQGDLKIEANGDSCEDGDGGATNRWFIVPSQLSPIYTGRSAEIERLKDALRPDGVAEATQRIQKRAAIHGFGGAGKTQLGLKVAHELQDHFWGVFWIDLSSPSLAEECFDRVPFKRNRFRGRRVSLIEQALFWLSSCSPPWLLILDGADDPGLQFSQYIPGGTRGSVMIISRRRDAEMLAPPAARLSIEGLTDEDSAALFLQAASVESDGNHGEVEKIAARLGNLPLALVQAGSTIRALGLTIQEFSTRLSLHKDELLESGSIALFSDYHLPVYASWDLTVNYIRKYPAPDSDPSVQNALELLGILSILDCRFVLLDIFFSAQTFHEKLHQGVNELVLDDLIPGVIRRGATRDLLMKALNVLESFSLVQTSTVFGSKKQVTMHSLVHSWARHRLTTQGYDEKRLRRMALATLGLATAAEDRDTFMRSVLRLHISSLFEHASATEEVTSLKNSIPGAGTELAIRTISLWSEKPLQANEILKELCEELIQLRGDTHPDTLLALYCLRTSFAQLSMSSEALEIDRRLYKTNSNLFGKRHPVTIRSRLGMVDDYLSLRNYDEAQSCLEKLRVDLCKLEASSVEYEELRLNLDDRQLSLDEGLVYILSTSVGSFRTQMSGIVTNQPSYDSSMTMDSETKASIRYPVDIVAKWGKAIREKDCHKAYQICREAYFECVETLHENHPLTERFYTYGNSLTAMLTGDMSAQSSLNHWAGQGVMASIVSQAGPGRGSSFSYLWEKFGPASPTALQFMVATAQRSKVDVSIQLVQAAKELCIATAANRDPSMNLECRALVAMALAFPSHIYYMHPELSDPGRSHKELAQQMLRECLREIDQLLDDVSALHGRTSLYSASLHLRFAWFIGRMLCEHEQSCVMAARAAKYIQIRRSQVKHNNPTICNLLDLLREECYFHLRALCEFHGDPAAADVMFKIQVQAEQRYHEEKNTTYVCLWESRCCSLEVLPDNSQHNCFSETKDCQNSIRLPDCLGLEHLGDYWLYRDRADHNAADVARQKAADQLLGHEITTQLLDTFVNIVLPYTPQISEDWDGDARILASLICSYITQNLDRYEGGPVNHDIIVHLHEYSVIQEGLGYLGEAIDASLLVDGLERRYDVRCTCIYTENHGIHAYPYQVHECQRSSLVEKLQRKLVCKERQKRGVISTVAEESFRFSTQLVLYVASGFVWEAWLDDHGEVEKSNPFKVAQDVARDIRGAWDSSIQLASSGLKEGWRKLKAD